MLVLLIRTGFLASLFVAACHGASLSASAPMNAKQIQELLVREKSNFTRLETKRREVLSKLDQLNQNQNQVRKRLSSISLSQQELNMAAENLGVEVQKQKDAEKVARQRLGLLLKVVYRIHRDGILRFAMSGGDLGTMVKRARVLYRTLRSNTLVAQQMQVRSKRLADTEQKLEQAKQSLLQLTSELREQEGLLGTLLEQKKRVLTQLRSDQQRYQNLKDQYQVVQEEVKSLFDGLDKTVPMFVGAKPSVSKSAFLSPLESGTLLKRFGKTVHDKFRTVVPHKGLEIEATHKSPVRAVAEGKVEFEGWIRGLGNVVVLQHPGGYFSLSAHLFESSVKAGDSIAQGQTIGAVGDTGTNAKPSLYFELRYRGKAVDPLSLFRVASAKSVVPATTQQN
jgi:murein hydrolase activator